MWIVDEQAVELRVVLEEQTLEYFDSRTQMIETKSNILFKNGGIDSSSIVPPSANAVKLLIFLISEYGR